MVYIVDWVLVENPQVKVAILINYDEIIKSKEEEHHFIQGVPFN